MKQKNLITGILALGAVLLLTSCSSPFGEPLPPAERYKGIHNIEDQINYEQAGTLIQRQYDRNSGTITPSYLRIVVEGENSFKLMQEDILSIPDLECGDEGEEGVSQLRCTSGFITINMGTHNSPPPESMKRTELLITDSSSGRK